QSCPFRTERFRPFPDLSFLTRRDDAWMICQRLAAFLDLMLDLAEDGFSRRSVLFVLFRREGPGLLLDLITDVAHQLVVSLRRRERGTDGRTECNAQSCQNDWLVAGEVEHVAARGGGARREGFHSSGCPVGGLRHASVNRRGGVTNGRPRLAGA